jgi:hypothetical protein
MRSHNFHPLNFDWQASKSGPEACGGGDYSKAREVFVTWNARGLPCRGAFEQARGRCARFFVLGKARRAFEEIY